MICAVPKKHTCVGYERGSLFKKVEALSIECASIVLAIAPLRFDVPLFLSEP
jgi:hypothetical protein